MNLVRRNAVLAVDQHPKSREPLLQCDRAILKDRELLDGELIPAGPTFPALGGLEVVGIPAHSSYGINADLFVAKVLNRLLPPGFNECLTQAKTRLEWATRLQIQGQAGWPSLSVTLSLGRRRDGSFLTLDRRSAILWLTKSRKLDGAEDPRLILSTCRRKDSAAARCAFTSDSSARLINTSLLF